ncbi:SEC1 family transport protein SLY1 [Camellia lanceoleosa]|uniref:SEC1 family transport protein SLY1 n=1 Tax=Camellia lanceoleosa TaxID=1840588 RepID=A0ACC0IAL6_9ERIC|nr:SEC1 family transport protein SLY1 [Camellia lanceoleosa]
MLKLNQLVNSSGTANEEVYMILIYYKFCQDILFPLIYVKDLCKHGVTLYILIDEDRKLVHDVLIVRDSFMISRAQLGFGFDGRKEGLGSVSDERRDGEGLRFEKRGVGGGGNGGGGGQRVMITLGVLKFQFQYNTRPFIPLHNSRITLEMNFIFNG